MSGADRECVVRLHALATARDLIHDVEAQAGVYATIVVFGGAACLRVWPARGAMSDPPIVEIPIAAPQGGKLIAALFPRLA